MSTTYTRRFTAQDEANSRWGLNLQQPESARLVAAARRMTLRPMAQREAKPCRFTTDPTFYRRLAVARGLAECGMCHGEGWFLMPISEYEAEKEPCHVCRVDPVYAAAQEQIPLDDIPF